MRFVLVLLALGCGQGDTDADAGVPLDAGVRLDASTDGDEPVRARFTISGCAAEAWSADVLQCSGKVPLALTFVPLGSGLDSFVWAFEDHGQSTETSPQVTFTNVGTFRVTLTAGGAAGSETSHATLLVSAGALGDPCLANGDCGASETCFCAAGSCENLATGFCSRPCATGQCGASEVCADFGRGGVYVPSDGGTGIDPWRQPLCLPECSLVAPCRAGLGCRNVPRLNPGGQTGGAFTWANACFFAFPADTGESCVGYAGTPEAGRCMTGRCDALGIRGLCTLPCTSLACSQGSACSSLNQAVPDAICFRRCSATNTCPADPGLSCELPGATGLFGFSAPVGDPAGTRYCAPKRCTLPTDCVGATTCQPRGTASFCLP